MTLWIGMASLWRREVVRFLRQRNRIVGAVGSPILFWFLIGSGVGRTFAPPGTSGAETYLEYIFPGTLLMILLFTAIFSTISIIEDRKEGFLQSILVSPLPRAGFVMAKLFGGSTLALIQALIFLALAPLAGIALPWMRLAPLAGILFLLGVGMTGLGFVLAWRMQSVQGFHAVMNLLLLPLWVLSGALFPVAGAAGWLQWLMRANPLTYGLECIRDLLQGTGPGESGAFSVALGVTLVFAAAMVAASTLVARRPTSGDLQ